MNNLDFEFSQEPIPSHIMSISNTQILKYKNKEGHLIIEILLLINSAHEISNGIARSAMGKIKLWYTLNKNEDYV